MTGSDVRLRVTLDPEDLHQVAKSLARGQDQVDEAVRLLVARLAGTPGMAAGPAAAVFAQAYDQAAAAAQRAAVVAWGAVGLMADCLVATANNYLHADHASDAVTVHAHPDLLPFLVPPDTLRERTLPRAGGPGQVGAELLAQAGLAWESATTSLAEAGVDMAVGVRLLGERSASSEVRAAERHWSAIWRGRGYDGALLSAVTGATARLGRACLDLATAAGDPALLPVLALAHGTELLGVEPVLRRAAEAVPVLQVVGAAIERFAAVAQSTPGGAGAGGSRAAPTPPAPALPGAVLEVAALTGGRVLLPGQDPDAVVQLDGLGKAAVHVIGRDGSLIMVLGRAKPGELTKVAHRLQVLRRAAQDRGVPARVYFERGTAERVLDQARTLLGKQHVVVV
ncbi:hypothetical protein ACFVVX_34370 [Kitasatospora sp. NPDC058170]|uniref:hypothetical protein n=1 Tax=Kitasatospora sp. NPDC058170 TaxID=3346364 RepID=UPI0036D76E6F